MEKVALVANRGVKLLLCHGNCGRGFRLRPRRVQLGHADYQHDGTGLDTRGVRKQAPGVTYFEIDDADTLNFKKERLAEAGIEAKIVYIPGNYVADDLLRLLGVTASTLTYRRMQFGKATQCI